MVSGSLPGASGVELPGKPYGTIAVNLHGLTGQAMRGSLLFATVGDERRRFGVDGETY